MGTTLTVSHLTNLRKRVIKGASMETNKKKGRRSNCRISWGVSKSHVTKEFRQCFVTWSKRSSGVSKNTAEEISPSSFWVLLTSPSISRFTWPVEGSTLWEGVCNYSKYSMLRNRSGNEPKFPVLSTLPKNVVIYTISVDVFATWSNGHSYWVFPQSDRLKVVLWY